MGQDEWLVLFIQGYRTLKKANFEDQIRRRRAGPKRKYTDRWFARQVAYYCEVYLGIVPSVNFQGHGASPYSHTYRPTDYTRYANRALKFLDPKHPGIKLAAYDRYLREFRHPPRPNLDAPPQQELATMSLDELSRLTRQGWHPRRRRTKRTVTN